MELDTMTRTIKNRLIFALFAIGLLIALDAPSITMVVLAQSDQMTGRFPGNAPSLLG